MIVVLAIVGIVLIVGGIFFIINGISTIKAPDLSERIPFAPKGMEKGFAAFGIVLGLILAGFGIFMVIKAFSI
jgi:multisubunit Na+/H+ antiporter MnhG subunit